MKKRHKKIGIAILCVFLFVVGIAIGAYGVSTHSSNESPTKLETENTPDAFSLAEVPTYAGNPSVAMHDNIPYFSEMEKESARSFERFGSLDNLGRCTAAYACIDASMMPTEERGAIGDVEPSGWHLVKYDFLPDRYLYNRCHLIGYQLTGQNANEKNLITGTRYLNVDGMLPYENEVAAYLTSSENHVLYRVTPVFEADNLLADGVLMEAYSVEDDGAGICFCVFCYNVQPGVRIDYATGDSAVDEAVDVADLYGNAEQDASEAAADGSDDSATVDDNADKAIPSGITYVLNTNTKRFHKIDCPSVPDMAPHNTEYMERSRDEIISDGYVPCGRCNP